MKTILIIQLLILPYFLFSQNKNEEFVNLKEKQFVNAYSNKDTTEYLEHLSSFLDFYETLSNKEKDMFLNVKANAFYNLSCIYSILNVKDRSLFYLGKSIDYGFNNLNQVTTDADLMSIRNEDQYAILINKLRMIYDYQFLLSNENTFSNKENLLSSNFTYQSPSNKNLTKLRTVYKLDSIAGNGSEMDRIKNVLFWVHKRVKHDGNINNPKIKNAINFIEKCDKRDVGLNCRGMALLLNECYLSLGFKSRIICCFPKDSLNIDSDCHVLTSVYSTDLKKWIWVDPTMNTLVMDVNNTILSIDEVRTAIIRRDSLKICPEANWNGDKVDVNQYLYQYMAKNLYYLESPISSEFNFETRRLFKKYAYVKLSPINYYSNSSKVYESKSVFFTKNISYITTNKTDFWVAPTN